MTTNDQPSVPHDGGQPPRNGVPAPGGQPPQVPGQMGAPGYGPPPQSPKKPNWFARHKVLTGVFVVFGLFVVIGIGTSLGSGGSNGSSDKPAAVASADASSTGDATDSSPAAEQKSPAPEQPAEPAAAGIGTPVADGSFEFTVTSIEPGVSSVGDQYLGKQAQGQFVIVHLTVSNIGKSAKYFTDSNQLLLDAQGREHKADSTAGLYAQPDNQAWLTEINPGNTLTGLLVFDIPTDTTPAAIELHDSMFSGGVTVQLG